MKIDRQQLEQAARRSLLQTEQVAPLWQFLEQDTTPAFASPISSITWAALSPSVS